jgi:hypothetical protein
MNTLDAQKPTVTAIAIRSLRVRRIRMEQGAG